MDGKSALWVFKGWVSIHEIFTLMGRLPPIIFARIDRLMIALQINFIADFLQQSAILDGK